MLMKYEIDISNSQSVLSPDLQKLTRALESALGMEHVAAAVLSVSIVDNAAIHQLNRDHLQHDYPTDVISFALERRPSDPDDELPDDEAGRTDDSDSPLRSAGFVVEGEIVASAEMACEMAADGRWTPLDELQLYLIHGMLHLCGYDDLTPEERHLMRIRERAIMASLGLKAVYADDQEISEMLARRTAVEQTAAPKQTAAPEKRNAPQTGRML